jgi:hypothetical protein
VAAVPKVPPLNIKINSKVLRRSSTHLNFVFVRNVEEEVNFVNNCPETTDLRYQLTASLNANFIQRRKQGQIIIIPAKRGTAQYKIQTWRPNIVLAVSEPK